MVMQQDVLDLIWCSIWADRVQGFLPSVWPELWVSHHHIVPTDVPIAFSNELHCVAHFSSTY